MLVYTAGQTPVLLKNKWEDRDNSPRIVDVELHIQLWYEVARISSWKYCNLLHSTVIFQGHVSTKHTLYCGTGFWHCRSISRTWDGLEECGVFDVSWGKLCKKWPSLLPLLLRVNCCQEEKLLVFQRIVCALILAFYSTLLPHEGPDGVLGKGKDCKGQVE